MCVGSHCCLADLATPWLPTQVPPAADTLVAVGASVRTRAETVLPVVAAKLHLYVGDARTEALLMRAIKVCTGGGGARPRPRGNTAISALCAEGDEWSDRRRDPGPDG